MWKPQSPNRPSTSRGYNPAGALPVVFFGSEELSERFNRLCNTMDIQPLDSVKSIGFHRGGVVVIIQLDYMAAAGLEELQRLREELSAGATQTMGYVVPFYLSGSGQIDFIDLIETTINNSLIAEEHDDSDRLNDLLTELKRYQIDRWDEDKFENQLIGSIRRADYIRRYQQSAFFNAIISPLDGVPRFLFIAWPMVGWLVTLLVGWLASPSWLDVLLSAQALFLAYPVRNLLRRNRRDWRLSDRAGYARGLVTLTAINMGVLGFYRWTDPLSLLPWFGLGLVLHAIWENWAHFRERLSHAESMIPLLSLEEDARERAWKSQSPHADSVNPAKLAGESEKERLLRSMRHKTRWGMFRDASPSTWTNVFISHRRLPIANQVATALHDALRMRGLMAPWLDLKDLTEGRWRFDIAMAMAQSGVVVVVLTPETETDLTDQANWAGEMGFVTGEMELAFNLAVQYGQPEIILLECGASATDLDLPEELRANLDNLRRIKFDGTVDPAKLRDTIQISGIIEDIESTLYRDTPTAIIAEPITKVLSFFYVLLWLSRLFTIPLFLAMVAGWSPQWAVWQQGLFLLSLFSGSLKTHVAELIQRVMAKPNRMRSALDQSMPFGGLGYYALAWAAAAIFLWVHWDIAANPWLQIALCGALWLNLNANLLTPTIWQAQRQKHAAPLSADQRTKR